MATKRLDTRGKDGRGHKEGPNLLTVGIHERPNQGLQRRQDGKLWSAISKNASEVFFPSGWVRGCASAMREVRRRLKNKERKAKPKGKNE